jgi:hypothetical protein
VITTYEGKHNHDVPAARNSGHEMAAPASPATSLQDQGLRYGGRQMGGAYSSAMGLRDRMRKDDDVYVPAPIGMSLGHMVSRPKQEQGDSSAARPSHLNPNSSLYQPNVVGLGRR